VRRRMIYTGYLRRQVPVAAAAAPENPGLVDGEFLLVTPGGGGDGDGLIDWVLAAYEQEGPRLPPALIVFGPFMLTERQTAFAARAERLANVYTLTFEARLEHLMARARGIVAMGGYNTFCEILSFDKPALIVPRTTPRLEQFIRRQHDRLAKAADAVRGRVAQQILEPGPPRRSVPGHPPRPPPAAQHPARLILEVLRQV